MGQNKWIGRRVIKTGLAVFITAWICNMLDLPAMFAVITAIVTTEPTAADSIKKGIVRLPAAALGALFAILVDLLLGQSALTYTLVSMLTIIACQRFKLDNGTLIATLTAVAMIPGTSEGLLLDFMIRLSGTSIGIIVSTLVNFVILPPKFGPLVVHKVDELYRDTAFLFERVMSGAFADKESGLYDNYRQITNEIEKAYQLTRFQDDEIKYRTFNECELRSFQFLQTKLKCLQRLVFHTGNISFLEEHSKAALLIDKKLMLQFSTSMAEIMRDPLHEIEREHYALKGIMQARLEEMPSLLINNQINPKFVIHFELLAIQTVLEQLSDVTAKERQFSQNEQLYPKYIFASKGSI